MTGNSFLDRPRRSRARLAAYGLIAALTIGVIGYALSSGGGHGSKPSATSHPSAGATAAHAGGAPSRASVPTEGATGLGVIHLVQGSTLINGMYLGFPHTTIGAISAAVEYMTQLGTLEPDRAAAVARLAADTTYTTAQNDAATGAINDRRALGLADTGALPPGASLQIEPVEYQLRDVAPDHALVLLLSDLSTSTPTGGAKTQLAVFPMSMRWNAGDWKFGPLDASADWTALSATPGSAAAQAHGWQEFAAS